MRRLSMAEILHLAYIMLEYDSPKGMDCKTFLDFFYSALGGLPRLERFVGRFGGAPMGVTRYR
jgi:hypothetical protein